MHGTRIVKPGRAPGFSLRRANLACGADLSRGGCRPGPSNSFGAEPRTRTSPERYCGSTISFRTIPLVDDFSFERTTLLCPTGFKFTYFCQDLARRSLGFAATAFVR